MASYDELCRKFKGKKIKVSDIKAATPEMTAIYNDIQTQCGTFRAGESRVLIQTRYKLQEVKIDWFYIEDEDDEQHVSLREELLQSILRKYNYSAITCIELLLYSATGDKSWYVKL